AKAASAARLLQDAAATGAMEDLRQGVRGAQQDDGAAIPRPPPGLRRPEEAAQQFGVVGLVHLARRAAGARPALGPDAGLPPQGEHPQPRVVSGRGEAGLLEEILGLEPAVGPEAVRGLQGRPPRALRAPGVAGEDDLISRRLQHATDLPLLPRAPSG